jgi:CarD family transcriptional regulator
MAARKKVTKKAQKPAERGGAKRSTSKTKRVTAAESSKKRPAPAARAAKAAEPVAKVSMKAAAKPAPVASVPRKMTAAVGLSESKAKESKEIVGGKQQGAAPAPARNASAPTTGGAGAAAKAPGVAADKPAAAAALAPTAPVAAKAAKAPAPAKSIEREPSGGEQKTMKNNANKHGFKLNEFVVYPAHGVGQIVAMEEQEVAGFKLELFVINFVKDKMTLRVPTSKVAGVGMRKLSDPAAAQRSLDILTGRARIKRTMWSRRAQEYEAKINSGDINAIAEVVRDLYRSEAQPEQSYSERQLYEAALDRMMREIAAVQKLSETEALKLIETQLKKNTKRGAKGDSADGEDGAIEEAA